MNSREMQRGSMDKKTQRTIKILIGLVAFLLLVIVYFFVAQPQMSKFVAEKQSEGVNYAVGSILASIQSQGYVEIPVGNESLILVPYVPPQEGNAQQPLEQ